MVAVGTIVDGLSELPPRFLSRKVRQMYSEMSDLKTEMAELKQRVGSVEEQGGITPGANLTYLAPPQDNFSWVPNRSLGPQKCKEFLSSKINSIAL